MKKKPPPGATLIARMKEQRLAREAELARRQAEQEGTAAPSQTSPSAQTHAPEPQPEPAPVSSVQLETSAEDAVEVTVVEPNAASEPFLATAIAQPDARSQTAEARQEIVVAAPTQHLQTQPTPAHPTQIQPTLIQSTALKASAGDLIQREIDIQDLRPTTDDYFVLTDEIRLAGRFAAVGLIAQGLRLGQLKHHEIYKIHYPTFEDYCRKEHQMSATYAYRLIRMAEMAERIAEIGGGEVAANTEAMPDPFEVMLSLGHRHLMALLPLEVEKAQDLLVHGIPVPHEGEEQIDERVPIGRATERQIREALRSFTGESAVAKVASKKAAIDEKQLIPALSKLVEMLEDWSVWLGGESPEELETARMNRGQLLTRLAKRFRTASGKIADALEGESET